MIVEERCLMNSGHHSSNGSGGGSIEQIVCSSGNNPAEVMGLTPAKSGNTSCNHKYPWPVVMIVAGLDPTGGAGVIADAVTVASLGCHPCVAVTAKAIQTVHQVGMVACTDGALFAQQIEHAASMGPDAVKVGMLGNGEVVETLVAWLDSNPAIPVVLDPVLASTGGFPLLDGVGREALLQKLLPRVSLLTPNAVEAGQLTGLVVNDAQSAIEAARKLVGMGVGAVLVKGGHMDGNPVDVLCIRDGGGGGGGERTVVMPHGRVAGRGIHGSGCRLSSAIAAGLARGIPMEQAVASGVEWFQDKLAGPIWERTPSPL